MKLNLLGGVLVGLFSSLVFYGLYWSGMLRSEEGGKFLFLASAAHAAALILVLSRHRANALPAAIPFFKLFGAGLFLSFVAGVVVAIGSFLFTTQVDPTYLPWVIEETAAHLKTLELPEAELQQQLASLPERVTPGSYAFQGLVGLCMTGLFLTLVIAAFLRIRAMKLAGEPPAAAPPAT